MNTKIKSILMIGQSNMAGRGEFDDAVNNAKLAKRSSEIIGIIWHQGENDATSENDATTYKQRFIKMISVLREELGNSEIPVIVGEPGRFLINHISGRYKYIDTIIHTLKELPKNISYCGFANSEGLTDRGDGLHFNSASYRILGKRYFDEFKKLYSGSRL